MGGVLDILKGQPLYAPFNEPPYTQQNYPPVFMAGVAGLSLLTGAAPLDVGRLASIASALFCGFACASFAWRFAENGTARTVRGISALAAGLIFLGAAPVIVSAPLIRVDFSALALSLAGLWVFALSRYRPMWVASACALFVLAAFTKPTTLGALIACCGVALLTRPKVGLAMIAGCATAAIAGIAALDAATGGEFSRHVIWANANAGWRGRHALTYIREFAFKHPASLLVACGAALAIGLVSARATVADLASLPRLKPSPRRAQFTTLAAAYFGVSAALALTAGKNGASFNYLLEVFSATAILAGVALPHLWRFVLNSPTATTHAKRRPIMVGAGVVLSLAVIAQVYGVQRDIGTYRHSLVRISRDGDWFADRRRIVDEIERAQGDVLTEDRMLALLGGKRVYFEFHDGSLLLNAGVIDPAPLLRKIEAREFPLIVVDHRTHKEIADEQLGRNPRRLSRVVQRGIASHYAADESYKRLAVYRPRPSLGPSRDLGSANAR